ncbi:MAG: hypothetical protein MN733_42280 [Nitrososphaera sp.]|nr:hypothetical protein [Nitrososphaera sp.]
MESLERVSLARSRALLGNAPVENSSAEEMNDIYKAFPITSVCRADLEGIGFDTSAVTDADMEELARKLADDYYDQLFWSSLEILASERLKIPKRSISAI